MAGIERVTRQLVVLLAVLLDAHVHGEELHGYALMKMARLSGPSTYRNLDRLEDARLVDARWEELPPGDDRPRRRYYRLNEAGVATARTVVTERRPDLLEHPPWRVPPVLAPRPGLGTLFGMSPQRAGDTG